MLIHFGVIPYLVFDGDFLPSKAATETERANRRKESKQKGLELYRLNKPSQAHLELQKAVDVTPAMARELIEELKNIGVQYVVAPYEADAQLVYLEKKGIIQAMLSEDSDLLVFGAKRLLTKLDQYGDCVEINRSDFTACREISLIGWSDAEFRRMAILSGCDYLASINGMGLKNAYRLVRKYKTIEKVVRMLQFDGKHHVPKGYLEAFNKAEMTFLHQRVFCPLRKDLVMLTEIEHTNGLEDFSFTGAEVDRTIAVAVANGELDPVTKMPINTTGVINKSPKESQNSIRRSISGTPFSEIRGNKSIDAFFKAKRSPLAELDPNSFTPSPTQERLLQQAMGTSWHSSPAPPDPSNRRSTALAPSVIYRSASSASRSNNRRPVCSTTSTPSKRRRLFQETDENEDVQVKEQSIEVRSRFFTANHTESNLSGKQVQKTKKAQDLDINIWSDDSVDDAMATLPDVPDTSAPWKTSKLKIFKDEQEKPAKTTAAANIRKEIRAREDSQSSFSSKATVSSKGSADTSATSFANTIPAVTQTPDKCVSTEQLAALAASCTHQQCELKELSSVDAPRQRTQSSLASSKDHCFGAKLQMSSERIRTPLQRLRAGALNRSESCGGIFNRKSAETDELQTVGNALLVAPAENVQRGMDPTPVAHAQGQDISTLKGSEDTWIPDSEDDRSDSPNEAEENKKPSISLGHFAFTR